MAAADKSRPNFPDLTSVLAWLQKHYPANRSWAATFQRQYLEVPTRCKTESRSCKADDGPSIEELCKVLKGTVNDFRVLRDLRNLPAACTSANRTKFAAVILSGLRRVREATGTAVPASSSSTATDRSAAAGSIEACATVAEDPVAQQSERTAAPPAKKICIDAQGTTSSFDATSIEHALALPHAALCDESTQTKRSSSESRTTESTPAKRPKRDGDDAAGFATPPGICGMAPVGTPAASPACLSDASARRLAQSNRKSPLLHLATPLHESGSPRSSSVVKPLDPKSIIATTEARLLHVVHDKVRKVYLNVRDEGMPVPKKG